MGKPDVCSKLAALRASLRSSRSVISISFEFNVSCSSWRGPQFFINSLFLFPKYIPISNVWFPPSPLSSLLFIPSRAERWSRRLYIWLEESIVGMYFKSRKTCSAIWYTWSYLTVKRLPWLVPRPLWKGTGKVFWISRIYVCMSQYFWWQMYLLNGNLSWGSFKYSVSPQHSTPSMVYGVSPRSQILALDSRGVWEWRGGTNRWTHSGNPCREDSDRIRTLKYEEGGNEENRGERWWREQHTWYDYILWEQKERVYEKSGASPRGARNVQFERYRDRRSRAH